jgi:hypothetical protein
VTTIRGRGNSQCARMFFRAGNIRKQGPGRPRLARGVDWPGVGDRPREDWWAAEACVLIRCHLAIVTHGHHRGLGHDRCSVVREVSLKQIAAIHDAVVV